MPNADDDIYVTLNEPDETEESLRLEAERFRDDIIDLADPFLIPQGEPTDDDVRPMEKPEEIGEQ